MPAGSLKIDAPFNDYKQFVDVTRPFPVLQDWTGVTKLHVRVRIASGFDQNASTPPTVQVYANSFNAVDGGAPDYHYRGDYKWVATGPLWTDYVVDLAGDGVFDPSKINGIGVTLSSGEGLIGGTTLNPTKPTAAVIYVDNFWLEGNCTAPTGGFGVGTTCGASWAVSSEGFVTAPGAAGACWHGYGYVRDDDGSTITPKNFLTCGAACMLKMTGTVGSPRWRTTMPVSPMSASTSVRMRALRSTVRSRRSVRASRSPSRTAAPPGAVPCASSCMATRVASGATDHRRVLSRFLTACSTALAGTP